MIHKNEDGSIYKIELMKSNVNGNDREIEEVLNYLLKKNKTTSLPYPLTPGGGNQ